MRNTGDLEVLAFDIFGTTVDWRTGVAEQVAEVATEVGADLDAGAFADAWRDLSLPSMASVRDGKRPWVYLDTLHRESLDELLDRHGVGPPSTRRPAGGWCGPGTGSRRGRTLTKGSAACTSATPWPPCRTAGLLY